MSNNKLAFTAFQKKPEYGVATIKAGDIKMNQNQLDHLIEKGSALHLNGREMPTANKVKERMYGVEFGASSQCKIKQWFQKKKIATKDTNENAE